MSAVRRARRCWPKVADGAPAGPETPVSALMDRRKADPALTPVAEQGRLIGVVTPQSVFHHLRG